MISHNDAEFDLVVIGGGPGGYVAAVRAAQLGLKTACVDKNPLGGTCLNWGCIPTKTLLHQAEILSDFKASPLTNGLDLSSVNNNYKELYDNKNKIIDRLSKGIGLLLKQGNITHYKAVAKVIKSGEPKSKNDRPCVVELTDDDGVTLVRTSRVIVATGSLPRQLPFAPYDGQRIIGSTDALNLKSPPSSLIVIGSGAIGVEFASFFQAFGTKVTIVELLDRILPNEDDEISKTVAKLLKRRRINSLTGQRVTALQNVGDKVVTTIQPVDSKKEPKQLEADIALVAIGVKGNSQGLFAEKLGIDIDESGHLLTDYQGQNPAYQTSLPGIYAIGDVIGPPYLAHVASAEATVCVDRIAGIPVENVDYHAIPGCTYCQPQVASIGATQRHLTEQGMTEDVDYVVGRYALTGHGMSVALGHNTGLIKVIADKNTGILLGGHMVGHNVTELIGELAMALRLGATLNDIAAVIHPHPTQSEAIHEAALAALGKNLHS